MKQPSTFTTVVCYFPPWQYCLVTLPCLGLCAKKRGRPRISFSSSHGWAVPIVAFFVDQVVTADSRAS
jgi:hypothetical protein